jgi:hypothetical protein
MHCQRKVTSAFSFRLSIGSDKWASIFFARVLSFSSLLSALTTWLRLHSAQRLPDPWLRRSIHIYCSA